MSTTPSLHSATARDSDNFNYDLSNAIYGAFPSCATDTSPRRSRAAPPTSTSNSSRKRKPSPSTSKPTLCHRAITLNRVNSPPTWLPTPNPRTTTSPLATRRTQQPTTIHTTTCHALNSASEENDQETDLWILPELDDWEEDADTETETPILTPSSSAELDFVRPCSSTGTRDRVSENKWAGVLRRAANSNLERLRTRLEGDGWDFVKQDGREEEDLDEEFDVVVLSTTGR